MKPAWAAVAALLLLGACAGAPHRSASDAAQLAACRDAADRVYAKQNRGELYETDRFDSTGRDSPFSVGTVPDVPSRGLAGAYQRDTMVSDCLNATAAATPNASVAHGPAGRAPTDVPPPPPLDQP
jgi:hypothetical protein